MIYNAFILNYWTKHHHRLEPKRQRKVLRGYKKNNRFFSFGKKLFHGFKNDKKKILISIKFSINIK